MDRNTAKAALAVLENLLGDHADFDIEIGRCSYTSTEAEFKVVMRKKGQKSSAMQMAELMAGKLGVNMEAADGSKITGYKPKAPKRPWIVRHPDGKDYVYTDDLVKMKFAA